MARPRMKDVAARAGVDVSTVSRALNEGTRHLLNPETARRVLEVAEELGYRPNVLAQGLRTQRSRTVGMLVPDLGNPFFPPIVRGIEDALGARGYTLIVVNTDNDPQREEAALRRLLERQVEGLLLATSHIDDSTTALPVDLGRHPIVLVNRRWQESDVPSVVPDDAAGARQVAEHLGALGHRHVAHVAGPQGLSTGRTRLEAFRAACGDAGIDRLTVEVATAFVAEAGEKACRSLLTAVPDVTAVFAANDLLAIGSLRALRDAGRRVPDDVSLIGYNDMPMVDLIDPALTTVRVPQYDMGTIAAQLLLDQLDGVESSETAVVVPATLVTRHSTRPCRTDGGGRSSA